MRAAIYARYSSDNQRDASIEDQVRLCRERVEREGWGLVQTYADRRLTGSTMLRPGIQALLEDAMAGRFDVVVAEALDRLSRDQEDVAELFKRLSFAGIRIITLAEGEIGDLHVGLKGTMNALYLKDLADKTRRGLRGRVEAGASGGGNSYGYDVVHEPGPDGSVVRGGRRINPDEAAVVQRIFRDYAHGLSPKRIAYALNAEGVASPSGAACAAGSRPEPRAAATATATTSCTSRGRTVRWCGAAGASTRMRRWWCGGSSAITPMACRPGASAMLSMPKALPARAARPGGPRRSTAMPSAAPAF